MRIEQADYVIVGAGSAGCVLANRLSAHHQYNVVLLEAGGTDLRPWIRIPIGYGKVYYDAKVNWKYHTEPETALGGNPSYWPRGKVLGGSSAINAMVYVRGAARDYDDWARSVPGWSWRDVEPYFRRLERWEGPQNPGGLRGHEGPIPVRPIGNAAHPVCEAYLQAGEEYGLPRNEDYNAESMHGVALYQHTIDAGTRASAAHCYLRPVLSRPNLTLHKHALAARVLLDGHSATGVEFVQGGQRRTVMARREVVLCAGAVNTPQLLELSGIGQSQRLRQHGIRVVAERGAVGEYLQDHLGLDHLYRSKVPTLNQGLAPWWGKLWSGLQYALARRGPLALSLNQGGGFMSLHGDTSRPDVQLYFSPLSYTRAPALSRPLMNPDAFPGFLLGFNPCRPDSRGSIHIVNSDPLQAPSIRPNYLSTDHDREQMLAGARVLRELAAMPALANIIAAQLRPGRGLLDDESMWEFIAANAWTVFHPCGTCRMGTDPNRSVVDGHLRVHGIDGLRVADASVFPSVTSGNTNAPTLMVGERAADLIASVN